VSPSDIEHLLTQGVVDDLCRCGVQYAVENDGFVMFV
jgi:hypothetical protein